MRELPWDSGIFGFRCASLQIPEGSVEPAQKEALLVQALVEAGSQAVRFLTARVPCADVETVNACLRAGGVLVDTELTFRKDKSQQAKSVQAAVPSGFVVEKVQTYWHDGLYQLVDTLEHSRFFTDPNIDDELARKLWRTSIHNSCTGRASYSIVCRHGAEPAGLINVFEADGVSDIFLIAMLPAYQGKGLGRAMVACYEANLSKDIVAQTVETQLINYPAQRFYARLGYQNVQAKHTIHFWLGEDTSSRSA